jgi:chromosomal replication initiator protein
MNNDQIIELRKIWDDCLSRIRTSVTKQSFKTWFEPIVPLELADGELKIRVPSQFFYEWLEERYYPLIIRTLAGVLGREVKISHSICPDGDSRVSASSEAHPARGVPDTIPISDQVSQPHSNDPENFIHSSTPSVRETATALPTRTYGFTNSLSSSFNSFLHPRYTFENFIKGDSNQLARAAALAVANNPGGTSFNPLVIYGGVGLGKTHLIQAIGNHVLHQHKAKRAIYVSSEKFTVDFVDSIQRDTINDFSSFYRSMDVLIVDDIQFFAGKEKTQDSFFHIFNTLHQLGRQIVLSSDRPPKELKGLDERLISRFQWGLTADIQPPDLETRIAILRKKSEQEKIEIPQDVVEFIAANVTTNIRELEGCLIGLLAKASLEDREITLALAQEVLKSVVGSIKYHISIEGIQRTVCEFFDIPEDLIRAKTRKQEVVSARQIAMYLAKELTNSSLKTIGLHFGGRDHSTVIHSYQTVEDQMRSDEKFSETISQLRKKVELAGK